jgi:hypothetical protein
VVWIKAEVRPIDDVIQGINRIVDSNKKLLCRQRDGASESAVGTKHASFAVKCLSCEQSKFELHDCLLLR